MKKDIVNGLYPSCSNDMYTLNTDGGARGNPGPAAIGGVLKNENGETVEEISRFIGKSTNNFAEYTALIDGLELAVSKNINELRCFLDSELVVKQLNGLYKVKDPALNDLHKKVRALCSKFSFVSFAHVSRDMNKEADKLVNKVLENI